MHIFHRHNAKFNVSILETCFMVGLNSSLRIPVLQLILSTIKKVEVSNLAYDFGIGPVVKQSSWLCLIL